MRICNKCYQNKGESEYPKKGGQCKSCIAEKAAVYYSNNRKRLSEYAHEWKVNNRQRLAQYRNKRYHSNPQHRYQASFYSSARKVLKGIRTGERWSPSTVGCAPNEFINHLISTIPAGYTIKDYGSRLEIDHINPCYLYDLSNDKSRNTCFHYTNLRLIPKEFNRSRSR